MIKFLLIFHTLIHLRPIQIRYQIWYRLRRVWRRITGFKYSLSVEKQGTFIRLQPWIEKQVSFSDGDFTFLNLSKKYKSGDINRSETDYGKLWEYNLNYMDYLLQPGMDNETGLHLIEHFIEKLPQNSTGTEPYPIALRGINWIKFLSVPSHREKQPSHSASHREERPSHPVCHCEERREGATKQSVNIQNIQSSLYAQYKILLDNLEYHLLGNHLLEDGFSLLFGAFYFIDMEMYRKASQIIRDELSKQILEDGAHFELSPMYHQIILDRLLDSINLIRNNQRFADQNTLLVLMRGKAEMMIAWLKSITFSNGQVPLLNDAAPCIAPEPSRLQEYAASLGLPADIQPVRLGASGYRRYNGSDFECIIDIGPVGPEYQPGHAHADTFNMVIHAYGKPFLVDTGISTYDAGKVRLGERGTATHNTVSIRGLDSSEVWSSFRVGRRAQVNILADYPALVAAEHDGYRQVGTRHKRVWSFSDAEISVTDTLTGGIVHGTAHFHFAPELKVLLSDHTIMAGQSLFKFENAVTVRVIEGQIPDGYNRFIPHYKAEVEFTGQLKTVIQFG